MGYIQLLLPLIFDDDPDEEPEEQENDDNLE